MRTKTFDIHLANKSCWSLIGIGSAIFWLEKFAHITKLSPAKKPSINKIVVIRSRKANTSFPIHFLPASLRGKLPKAGWQSHNLSHSQIWFHPQSKTWVFEINRGCHFSLDIIRMWSLLDIIHQQAVWQGGFPIHAALIRKGKKGVIIAAHGGTGKSTCYRRIPSPWIGMCDDEVLVVKNKQGHYFAHPCPTWSNYLMHRKKTAWSIEQAVPLVAFCFLKQAKKDKIISIGQGQGAILINQHALQVSQRSFRSLKKETEKTVRHTLFENACKTAKTLPSYILEAHKNGKFWEELEQVINYAA
jgi:SynChlorMet cassette protein ScmC